MDDSLEQWRLIDEESIRQIDQLRNMFMESDISKDGNLNVAQLKDLFLKLDDSFTEDQITELFSKVDKDNSGSVDIEEFFSYIFKLDEAKEMAMRHKGGLHSSTVFCRIRPMAADGGHAEGEAVEMKLEGWTDESIQVVNRHDHLNFTFPKVVITPEKTQQETFDLTMPQFLDAWLLKCYNVQLLAYGQTGTGKTHTMFGTRESLSSDEAHPDWGLFPRIVNHCFKQLEVACKMYTGCKWALTASAVEFYMTQAFDLLYDHGQVCLDADGAPVGLATRRIRAVSDLVPFLDTVNATRTMSKTKMNEGSSRSHCALILTLHQNDHKTREMMSTTFTVVDMAGSERVTKTGADFVAPNMVSTLMAKGGLTKKQQQGAEGGLINFELTCLATEVLNATEAHRNKRRYIKPRGTSATDTLKFLGMSLEGNCLLGMVVCISQAPQNGWETWFSCTYGEQLARLKAPLKKVKMMNMDKEMKAAEQNLKRTNKAVADTKGGGRGKEQFLQIRQAAARGAEDYLKLLQELAVPP